MGHVVRRVNKLRCCVVNALPAPIKVITIDRIRISVKAVVQFSMWAATVFLRFVIVCRGTQVIHLFETCVLVVWTTMF